MNAHKTGTDGTFEIIPFTPAIPSTTTTDRTIHVRRPGTTRFDAIIISVIAVAFGLFLVVGGALVVIGVVDVMGAGEIFGRVLGVFWFVWGVGALGTVIVEARSDFPWARDDSDRSDITSREKGVELGDFDFDDGSD